MPNVTRLFHVIHVVDELAAAERWYDRLFSGQYFFRGGYSPVEQRDASLFAVGDFVLEPMTPSREPGAGEKPVGRFQARFGSHLHSIAFYVRSVPEIFERLRARGVRIVGDGGGVLNAPPRGAIYTHPRDTGGLLEFMEPPAHGFDLRLAPGWSSAFWRDEHPLGIERCSHLTLVVRDLERARGLWLETLEGRPFLERESRASGTRSLFAAVGDEVVVELAQPVDAGSAAGRELAANGEILHAATFRVRDLERAGSFLRELGLKAEERDGELELGPEQALGARYRFTQAALPGDPRG